jgi:hypothetical protein
VSLTRTVAGDLLFSGDTTGALSFGPKLAINRGFQDMFVARVGPMGAPIGAVELAFTIFLPGPPGSAEVSSTV